MEKVALNKSAFSSGGVPRYIVGGKNYKTSGKGKAPRDATELSVIKRSVTEIKNDDNACGYWAIALARLKEQMPSKAEWDRARKNRKNQLKRLAQELCHECGIDYECQMDRETMKIIDEKLKPDYQLICIDSEIPHPCIFKGGVAPKQLFIEHTGDHYNSITGTITGYMESVGFCVGCWTSYDPRSPHRCPGSCTKCTKYPACDPKQDLKQCNRCNIEFSGLDCFNYHQEKTCKYFKKCAKCEVKHSIKFPHKCNWIYCDKCKKHSNGQHHCFFKTKNQADLEKQDSRNKIIVAFDIESSLIKNGKYYDHVPSLLVSMVTCDECYDDSNNRKNCDFCSFCGEGKQVFEGTSCVKDFGDFVYKALARQAEKKNSRVLVFAHNLKGYDGHFVFRDLFDRNYKPEPIMIGSKIMMIDVGNVRFIDSLNLFQMPLANLPKSFGFESIALKGYFPHKFNIPDNYSYIGKIPSKEFFDPELMDPSAQEKFFTWYKEQESISNWSFDTEIKKYCINDTLILMLAVMKFRILFRETTGIDPVTRNFTLASIGLETYRAKFLKEQTIGITPVKGYSTRKSSKAADAWVDWIEHSIGRTIMRENRLGPYFADAFDATTNTIYEYNGCYFHGCPRCYKDREQILYSMKDEEDKTAKHLYDATQEKLEYYLRQGFEVVSKWGCETDEEMRSNKEKADFIRHRVEYYSEIARIGHASIRGSFFGGRTNNLRFYHDCSNNPNERIEYKDVTSEYPYVLKNFEYPIGHPKVIKSGFDFKRLGSVPNGYFGFVECKILPPEKLYLPVLPSRFSDKLMFVLCNACGATECETCNHSDDERALTGTWTTAEINKALEKGYKITTIYEILHYEEKSSELFKEYINMWLKVKQESSGWPNRDMTAMDKDAYVNEYFDKEGIRLSKSGIEKNPGKRSIAKLMLNSFWGKLSQRPNLPKTVVCKQPYEYFEIHENLKLKVTGEDRPNDETVIVSYELKNEEDADPGNTNIAIASFVTSYARLHLYKFMDEIVSIGEDRLLYFDTDSVIFVRKAEDPEIKTGNFLGDLTDELADYGPTAKCVKFVSGGPKNYAYEIHMEKDGKLETKTVVKTKGIRHDATTLNIVTMEKMTEMARRYSEMRISDEVSLKQLQFTSHKYKQYVRTEYRPKIYRMVSTKRVITGNSTLPYGFKK